MSVFRVACSSWTKKCYSYRR